MTSSSSLGPGKLQVIVDGVVTEEYECKSFEITPTTLEPIRKSGATITFTVPSAWVLMNAVLRTVNVPCVAQVERRISLDPSQPRREAQWKRERNNWRKR